MEWIHQWICTFLSMWYLVFPPRKKALTLFIKLFCPIQQPQATYGYLIKTKQSRKSICPTAVCSQWLPYWLTKMWSILSTETSLAALGRGCCWILLLWEWSLQDRIGVTLTNDLYNPLTRFVQEMKFTLPAQAACLEAHLGVHRYLGPYQTFSHGPRTWACC